MDTAPHLTSVNVTLDTQEMIVPCYLALDMRSTNQGYALETVHAQDQTHALVKRDTMVTFVI
ncbi:hypothetical protein D3C80_1843800 [compost metagenome]